jgi:hypothetical protein
MTGGNTEAAPPATINELNYLFTQNNSQDMKVCDVVGCYSEAAEVIEAQNADHYFTVNMCSFHYRRYRSDESIGELFHIKDAPVQQRHN